MKIIICLLLVSMSIFAQKHNIFFIGHSLVNHELPQIFNEIAKSGDNTSHTHKVQITNGAPLKWNWEKGDQAEGHNARVEIPKGDYDVVIMTEAVPLINHLKWSDTYQYGGNYYDLAIKSNKETQVYLYETWHCINSGDTCAYDPLDSIPWRKRLDDDLMSWQGITDSINKLHSGKKMLTIPAGQAMGALYDEIEKGNIPDLASIRNVFQDDIHLNDIGHYFIACVMYATVYKKSPVGLTNKAKNQWGNFFDSPSPELAKKMQEIAWKTVVDYPYSGVGNSNVTSKFVVYDNNWISIQSKGNYINFYNKKSIKNSHVKIFTVQGKEIYRSVVKKEKHSVLLNTTGFYIIELTTSQRRYTQRFFHRVP